MNRTEDLNVKVCEEANGNIIGDLWSCREARRPDRCRFREQEGRSWLEAISRHRDAAVTHWGNDCSDDEGNRLAAALGARFPCRRGAHTVFRRRPPPHLPRHLLFRVLAYRLQTDTLGDLDGDSQRLLDRSESPEKAGQHAVDLARRTADVRPGTVLGREWNGQMQRVAVLADGFAWNGMTYPSLSKVAFAITGTRWNGPKFFGLRDKPTKGPSP